MKNKNISSLINAYSIIQKENIFIVGCAKNIVALRKLYKENSDATDLLHQKDSIEKWVYERPQNENVTLKQLVPILKDGDFVKSNGKLGENEIEYTVHPEKLIDVYNALVELDEQDITIQLSKFNLDDLDAKEKTGWKPNNPSFIEAVNLLVELELFN